MPAERYRVQVDEQWFDVAIEKKGERYQVTIGDKTWEADFQHFEGTNLISLLLGNRSLGFFVDKERDTYTVLRYSEHHLVRVRPGWTGGSGAAPEQEGAVSEVTIESPMVGVIVQVAVKPREKVDKGDLLVVVEAMKMQNEIRAPRAGTVKTVRVTAGQKVTGRQPLLVLT